MKRTSRFLLLFLTAVCCVWAQSSTISSITIGTTPTGARFYVDGQQYNTSQTFLWPQGSKHVVQFPTVLNPDGTATNYQLSLDGQTQYTFNGWTASSDTLTPTNLGTITLTADPSISSLMAALTLSYKVQLNLPNTGTLQPNCTSPGNPPQDGLRAGIVYVGTQCYGSSTTFFSPAGALILNAIPYPGWVFTGWNINGGTFAPAVNSFNVTGPTIISTNFSIGQRVAFVTSPPGFSVLVDRTTTPTSGLPLDSVLNPDATCTSGASLPPAPPAGFPSLCLGSFDFIPGSQHTIGAVSPQVGIDGKYWVFDSFSNGQGNNSVYTAPQNITAPVALTAKFVPGVQMAFLTTPSGLKIQVDGRDSWTSYNFIWETGSSHSVAVAGTQTDSKGRQWTFQGWSNGGPASQTVVADGTTPRMVASFTGSSQIRIVTNPSGINLQVDGNACTTPCTVNRTIGSQMSIVAPTSVPIAPGARMDFLGWNDGSQATRSYTVIGDATIWANYSNSYQLSTLADPSNGGVSFQMSPGSADGFYSNNTKVTITAQAKPGFKFVHWGGALNGVYNVGQVTVTGPMTVIASVVPVPYIAPAGIQNAAGATPDGTVAPGSIISIYGESMAPSLQVGPTNPLAQTLAGVVVTVADRILPLLFVSPEQINAQVPSTLPDGTYTLTVHWTGQPDVSGTFTVSRNAPGLFSRPVDTNAYTLGSHEDGSPITADSPARKGETISIYGTGFGPYNQPVIDGFVLPDSSNFVLVDPVDVMVGDSHVQPVWAGGAPGFAGTVITKIKITDDMPSASTVPVIVNVNGKTSNSVLLPIQ